MAFQFQVSVIIPVYNVDLYLVQAVESCVHLEEVGEVVLIEDGSPDGALQICQDLLKTNDKVVLYRHPNGENRGAGASRNLGIQKARCSYVAFLDADDLYCSHRFKQTKSVFESNPEVDGVYEAVGIFTRSIEEHVVYSVRKRVNPDRLFHFLLRGTYGHFHTNGITVKKPLLEKCNGFNSALRLHQDADLWLKMAFFGKLVAGSIENPVGYVRRHDSNRITHANANSRLQYWCAVKSYFANKNIGFVNRVLLDRRIASFRSTLRNTHFLIEFSREFFLR